MPRIYVEFAGLERIGSRCKSVSAKVDTIQSELQSTVRQLDWDVRYASDINQVAAQIARKLEQYTKALKDYQRFLEDARNEYVKLDEYKQPKLSMHPTKGMAALRDTDNLLNFTWKDLVKSLGTAGSIFGIVNSVFRAKNWVDWGKAGCDIAETIASIAKDYNSYNKIGRAIGTTNSNGYFWRNFLGLNKVGRASTASSASARFYNNLHNKTSPYRLSNIFDSFTGKKGVVSAAASWAGLALSGVANWHSNREEQEKSNGTMSTGRVIAETVTETAVDFATGAVGSAIVGAAIATATGAVAAPATVAIATGLAMAGINAGVEAITGQSATEWISDAALNTITFVSDFASNSRNVVANWFGQLAFT